VKKIVQTLQDSKEFVIFSFDKNLGPRIVEYETYIRRGFINLLLDGATYEQLQEDEAKIAVDTTYQQIEAFHLKFGTTLSSNNNIYTTRSLKAKDPFAYFYLTAKVHKSPWKTRHIVSMACSITHGLGRLIDH
jgi:hypothetical protein